jgi:hypothetical protein
MAPSEFWQLRPRDFWWLVIASMEENRKTHTKKGKPIARLTKSEARDIKARLQEMNRHAAQSKDQN